MEHIRILLLGVSFRVYISYKIPRPNGTYTHASIRGFIQGLRKLYNLPAPWNIYAYCRILLLGVSFKVYISYKFRTRQKSEKDRKSGNGRNAWNPQRVHFSDWFFQQFVLDHANPQMYQSHKTLRLRREMSLPLTIIRPFRDNPKSFP